MQPNWTKIRTEEIDLASAEHVLGVNLKQILKQTLDLTRYTQTIHELDALGSIQEVLDYKSNYTRRTWFGTTSGGEELSDLVIVNLIVRRAASFFELVSV